MKSSVLCLTVLVLVLGLVTASTATPVNPAKSTSLGSLSLPMEPAELSDIQMIVAVLVCAIVGAFIGACLLMVGWWVFQQLLAITMCILCFPLCFCCFCLSLCCSMASVLLSFLEE